MLGIGKPWLSVFLLFWGYQTNDLSILFLSYMRRIVFARDHTHHWPGANRAKAFHNGLVLLSVNLLENVHPVHVENRLSPSGLPEILIL